MLLVRLLSDELLFMVLSSVSGDVYIFLPLFLGRIYSAVCTGVKYAVTRSGVYLNLHPLLLV